MENLSFILRIIMFGLIYGIIILSITVCLRYIFIDFKKIDQTKKPWVKEIRWLIILFFAFSILPFTYHWILFGATFKQVDFVVDSVYTPKNYYNSRTRNCVTDEYFDLLGYYPIQFFPQNCNIPGLIQTREDKIYLYENINLNLFSFIGNSNVYSGKNCTAYSYGWGELRYLAYLNCVD